MDIVTFARLHGVLIGRLVEDGRWHRVPTTSHPKKKNGAYMSRGVYGFIQDHAAHVEPIEWQPDKEEIARVDPASIARQVAEAAAQIRADQVKAAQRAAWILNQCRMTTHPYLAAKGFPEECGNVWRDERNGDDKLCIPMRADGKLVGLQTISAEPGHEKKFLYGQRTSETTYCIDNKGPRVYCEGFATGLSVRKALMHAKVRYTLLICFTAGNMLKVARNFGDGIVIADHDKPSEQHPAPGGHGWHVARELALPWWTSDREGEDFNDFEQRAGAWQAAKALKPLVDAEYRRQRGYA